MKIIAIIVLVMALMGCSGPATVDREGVVSNGEGSGSITEYKLSDGTRCAVLIGYKKGALDCDWGSGNDYE